MRKTGDNLNTALVSTQRRDPPRVPRKKAKKLHDVWNSYGVYHNFECQIIIGNDFIVSNVIVGVVHQHS